MAKHKKLPAVVLENISQAIASNTTLSLINREEFLPISGRENKQDQEFASIIGLDGTFTKEYFSKNNKGEDILKSDKYQTNDNSYVEANKDPKNNPHHHIKDKNEVEERLTSIINIRKINF